MPDLLEPLRSHWPFQRSVTRDLDQMMRRMFDGKPTRGEWMPDVDMVENKDGYVVRAELPGMKPEEVHVSVNGDVITISGEKHKEEKRTEDNWQVLERYSGSFTRSFRFPTEVRQESVDAVLKDGVLTVNVVKATESKSASIKVKGA